MDGKKQKQISKEATPIASKPVKDKTVYDVKFDVGEVTQKFPWKSDESYGNAQLKMIASLSFNDNKSFYGFINTPVDCAMFQIRGDEMACIFRGFGNYHIHYFPYKHGRNNLKIIIKDKKITWRLNKLVHEFDYPGGKCYFVRIVPCVNTMKFEEVVLKKL